MQKFQFQFVLSRTSLEFIGGPIDEGSVMMLGPVLQEDRDPDPEIFKEIQDSVTNPLELTH